MKTTVDWLLVGIGLLLMLLGMIGIQWSKYLWSQPDMVGKIDAYKVVKLVGILAVYSGFIVILLGLFLGIWR